jgi:hypothetical protein
MLNKMAEFQYQSCRQNGSKHLCRRFEYCCDFEDDSRLRWWGARSLVSTLINLLSASATMRLYCCSATCKGRKMNPLRRNHAHKAKVQRFFFRTKNSSERGRTSSALSSAKGLVGLLTFPTTLAVLTVLSSICRNFINAVSCAGLDCSMVCLRYLRSSEQQQQRHRVRVESRLRACSERAHAQVQPLPSLFQKLWIKPDAGWNEC